MGDPPSPATISFRTRTISTPARPKITEDITVATSWTPVEAPEDYPDKSAGESPSRARRSISSATPYFAIPKTFSISSSIGLFARRRKTTPRNASRPQARPDTLGDVIEIGPERRSRDENNEEEAERERLRDAAAQALGLGLGREGHTEGDADGEEDDAEATPVSEQRTHPYIHEPIPRVPPRLNMSPAPQSMTSLPNPMPSPSVATTSHTSDYIPAYPSALSALVPYIQTRSALLRYHPGATFLAISLNRRTKQWRPRHVILTAPLSPSLTLTQADLLSVPGQQRRSMAPQHAHLHLFKSATPDLDEVEIDRLEINEDSVVFVAEHEVAGRRDVVKVGGRDARGEGVTSASASVKSVARSWHSAATSSWEQNIEEMGRTMWLLKTTDGGETQHWIKYIKTAVLVQRAERAGMTFHPNGNSSGVPSMRADLDVLLSLRSQGLLPNAAREDTPPTTNGTSALLPPNPRYAEHVGAAPSHSSLPPSFRARTYPTPSNALALPSLKGLFGASQSNAGPPTPPPETHADIDPIAEESGSLGTRASALFNMFRSPSRASYSRANVSPMPMQTPAPIQRIGIGSPIVPGPIVDEAARKPSAPPTSFSVDWSTMQGGSSAVTSTSSKHTSLSLPPPPRSRRRPWTSAGPMDTQRRREELISNGKAVHSESPDAEASSSHHGTHTPTPPQSPILSSPSPQTTRRPPSLNSTSSYASAERDRLSDLSRRTPRTVPKMLAPPTGPPPTAPSMRSHSPSLNNGAPSPVFEQDYVRRNSSGRVDQHQNSWSSPNNPYSKRVSSSSARSVNTVSTGHSFLGGKSPPPPRPPPTFAPPPAPSTDQPESSSMHRNSSQARESFLPRSLRLSLLPPAAPPTHSLPPRPDEPGYRHRRSSSSEVKSTSNLFSIPGSPSPPEVFAPPPAPPPPRGPLPPTPTPENDKDGNPGRTFRTSSLNKRLRIMSTPVPPSTQAVVSESEQHVRHSLDRPLGIGEPILPHPEDQPHMFLHMNDTPTTPAMTQSPSFLHVPSPLQTSADDVEPTSLSPPPRRNSRASKELHKTPNLDRDGFLTNGSPGAEPRDSAVVIEQS